MDKTSDQGWTSLRGGTQVRKDHRLLAVGGELDELNSVLGAALAALVGRPADSRVRGILGQAQSALLDAGCALAAPARDRQAAAERLAETTRALEGSLPQVSQGLAPLRGFILPGGSPAGAWLHVARAVCRRCERGVAALPRGTAPEGLLAFLNRLSKWLFTAARCVNRRRRRPEAPWPLADGRKRR